MLSLKYFEANKNDLAHPNSYVDELEIIICIPTCLMLERFLVVLLEQISIF